jgi:hypothetical protein
VSTVRESIVVDSRSDCDICQVNAIPNQYGWYMDLVFFNFLGMLRVCEAEGLPLAFLRNRILEILFNGKARQSV